MSALAALLRRAGRWRCASAVTAASTVAAVAVTAAQARRGEARCDGGAPPRFGPARSQSPGTQPRAPSQLVGAEVNASERLVLSADCGGTTTRLMLYRVAPEDPIVPGRPAPGTLVHEEKYPNILFKSLHEIIDLFLHQDCGLVDPCPVVAVLALAGIVVNNQCRFTNLDWVVDGSELAQAFGIARVELINDFVAQGYGMLTLGENEVTKLNDVTPSRGAPIACIGAGTGLGQCFLVADPSGDYRCYPSEGSHVEFGPRGAGSSELQIDLLKYLKVKFSGWNRISVERVVSGTGICNVYEFLAHRWPDKVEEKVHRMYQRRPTDASVISSHAWPGSLCEHTLKIFASCYGAACGNLALTVQPFGGLYITGGVTKRLSDWLIDDSSFLAAYRDKGRLSPLLDHIPLFLVKGDDMGQRGAHHRAVLLLKHHVSGQLPRMPQSDEHLAKEALVPARGMSEELSEVAEILRKFKSVRSRRAEVSHLDSEPVFKTTVWKNTGDAKQDKDWVEREFWITRGGSIVYHSATEGRSLMYCTKADLENCTLEKLPAGASAKPFAFRVHPKPKDGTQLKPTEFASSSAEIREVWIQQIKALQQ